jgi:hypothetical protein
MNQVVLILISILAIWKIHDLFFPEKTKLGKQLIVKIIELKLTKAFYKDFLIQMIKDNKVTPKSIEKWLKTEYASWLKDKTKTDELSDIINTKE